MEKIILEYLDRYYYIQIGFKNNYGIYRHDTVNKSFLIDGSKLINEIKDIFSFDDDFILSLINYWAFKQKPDINLEFYWETKFFEIGSWDVSSVTNMASMFNNCRNFVE